MTDDDERARIARINREADAETFTPGQIVTSGPYGREMMVTEVKGDVVYCFDHHTGKVEGFSPNVLKNHGQAGPKKRR